jgi:hypothetical protein
MLLRRLVVVGLVGIAALAANVAIAQDAPLGGDAMADTSTIGAGDVSFADPLNAFSADKFSIDIGVGAAPRFASFAPLEPRDRAPGGERRYEVAVVARDVGGIDVAFAQRGGLGFDDEGELNSERRGAELRLGRLGANAEQPSDQPTWYIFAASEDEALTWRPGVRNEFGGVSSSFGLEQRIEIGDLQAGVTYERNGWQASFAYVEREISAQNGSRTVYQDETFTGVTLTLRH